MGTEHRQRQLAHPVVSDPTKFKDILLNNVERRKFIIDADIQVGQSLITCHLVLLPYVLLLFFLILCIIILKCVPLIFPQEQTSDLMYSNPKVDPATGELMEVMGGGGRRIDYLLLREGDRTRLASFWFLTALSSLSDHLPVAMMVQRIEEEQE